MIQTIRSFIIKLFTVPQVDRPYVARKRRHVLTSEEVREIEARLLATHSSSKAIQRAFNISQPTLSRIRNGKHRFSS